MVGESLVIKQGQPESHEINDKVIVNSPTTNFLVVLFLDNTKKDKKMKKFIICIFALIISVYCSIDVRLLPNNNIFRIDLRGTNITQNIEIVPNNLDFQFEYPNWCTDCVVINSNFDKKSSKKISVKFKTLNENDLVFIKLMGPDVRLDDRRIPVIVNYENFGVNGHVQFSKKSGFWHDKPYMYGIQTQPGQIIEFNVTASKPYGERFIRSFQNSKYMFIVTFCFWLLLLYAVCKFIDTHKKSKPDAFFVAVFFIILFFPMLHISNAKTSSQENRVLATKPDLIINNDVNEKFGTQFNEWFNDRFFGRNTFIKIFDTISYSLKNIYQNDKALFIKNKGWMFLKKDFPVSQDIKLIANNLKQFNDFCESYNMKLYVLVVPEKEQIYQDILSTSWYFDKKSETNFNNYVNTVTEMSPGVKIIYPYHELLNAKTQDYVFFKQSHHWTDFGAYVGYNALGKKITEDFNDFHMISLNDYNKTFSNKIRDDWGRGFNLGHTLHLLNLKNKADKLLNTEYTYYDNKSRDNIIEDRQRYTKIFDNQDKNVKHKLFLIGNSQNENLLQFLPYSVKKLKYLRLNWYQLDEANQWKFMKYYKQELLDFNPDIVVITITAEMFSQLMSDFYKD